jgi:hypothetical protein
MHLLHGRERDKTPHDIARAAAAGGSICAESIRPRIPAFERVGGYMLSPRRVKRKVNQDETEPLRKIFGHSRESADTIFLSMLAVTIKNNTQHKNVQGSWIWVQRRNTAGATIASAMKKRICLPLLKLAAR